jgi:hypothetical protein
MVPNIKYWNTPTGQGKRMPINNLYMRFEKAFFGLAMYYRFSISEHKDGYSATGRKYFVTMSYVKLSL